MCFCVRFCRQFVLNVSQQAVIEERGKNPIVSLCLLIGAASLQTIHRLHTETPEITSLCVTSVTPRLSAIVTEMKVGARFEEWVQKSCCFLRVNHCCPAAVVLPALTAPSPPKVKCTWGCSVCIYSEKESLFFQNLYIFLSNLMFENVLFFMMGGWVWSFEKRVPWVNRQEARTRQSLAPSGFRSWL